MNAYNEDFWNALDALVNTSEIVIDRPKGSAHPRFPDFIYRVDYGYLKDTSSMDGAGIDVWVGSGRKTVDAVMCIVDLKKRDSEIKILIGCTEEEMMEVYKTHNETLYRTPKGYYFLYVNGGEASPYKKEDIKSISAAKAEEWLK